MRVYIGPYKNWKTTYKFWDKFENKLPEKVINKLDSISQTIINYCWNKPLRKDSGQKIKVKIHAYDAFSADNTLAYIIHPLLKEIKNQKPGSPHVDDSDVPEDIRSDKAPPKKNKYDVDDYHHKRWEWVLDEMIWAFEQKTIDWESQYHSGKTDLKFEKIEGTEYYTMGKGPEDTHVFDKEGYIKHHERMRNGFRLFGKYYEGLWT